MDDGLPSRRRDRVRASVLKFRFGVYRALHFRPGSAPPDANPYKMNPDSFRRACVSACFLLTWGCHENKNPSEHQSLRSHPPAAPRESAARDPSRIPRRESSPSRSSSSTPSARTLPDARHVVASFLREAFPWSHPESRHVAIPAPAGLTRECVRLARDTRPSAREPGNRQGNAPSPSRRIDRCWSHLLDSSSSLAVGLSHSGE